MRKYIFGGITLLMIAAVAAWNVNLGSKNDQLSGISLANVEALADGDTENKDKDKDEDEDSDKCKWKNIQCPFPSKAGYGVCVSNGDGVECRCGATTHNPLPC
jgi:hypothetical protein